MTSIAHLPLIVRPKPARWVINDFLLASKGTKDLLLTWTYEYFTQNLNSVGCQTVLWEAYKTVIQGHLIQLSARRKKEKRALIVDLEKALEVADASFKAAPSPSTRLALDQAHMALDLALTEVAESKLDNTFMRRVTSQTLHW